MEDRNAQLIHFLDDRLAYFEGEVAGAGYQVCRPMGVDFLVTVNYNSRHERFSFRS